MNPDFWTAFLGGLCIGLASFIAAASAGKIPGISGVFSRIFLFEPGDTLWRLLFIIGLIGGALLAFTGFSPSFQPIAPLWVMGVAGLLVGLGTRLGGGCTSGHGVCGMGLGARDSMVATVIFMVTGMGTVFVTFHLMGGWK